MWKRKGGLSLVALTVLPACSSARTGSATLRRYRPAALLMLVLHVTGCYSWQPTTVSPRQFIEEEQPGKIRILQADGEQVEIRNPGVETDSISFRVSSGLFGSETVRIALSDVSTVEVQRFSIGKTVALVVLAPVGLVVIAVLICAADDCLEGYNAAPPVGR